MIEKAFIQAHHSVGTIPFNENAYLIWHGCWLMGVEIQLYQNLSEIENQLHPKALVQGGIGNVKRALSLLGAPVPPTLDIPDQLLPWFGRKIWRSTLGEIRRTHTERGPLFIKPVEQKAFTGYVVTQEFKTLITSAGLGDDTPIIVSEPVTFVSEYRTMVHKNEMVACRNYKGDICVTPDFGIVKEVIHAFADQAPVAYSLDVGVTDDGQTLCVELNDSYALGSYGTPTLLYTNMVIDRWEQMTESLV